MTQTKTEVAPAADVDSKDVFAIVLASGSLLDASICGMKVSEWVEDTISIFEHTAVKIRRGDDIVGIVKEHAGDKKYCVVVYADTPLLTRDTVNQALSFAASYNHKIVQLTRGWVFDVESIKKDEDVAAVTMQGTDETDFLIAYSHSQVAAITTYMRGRINEKHMQNGVFITDPYNVYIDAQVKIGAGTRIGPGVVLRGETEIGENCRVTNFVEIKKSKIGDRTKISHMSYVGDATVGKDCNIGCGVVFCNYDGKDKHPTVVGDNAFIGSNCNLIAPITIGNNAFVAAGSTVTQDIPDDALALARARQAIKENWRKEQEE